MLGEKRAKLIKRERCLMKINVVRLNEGHGEVKYITEDFSRAKLLALGLVAPTKAEKRELAQK